MESPAALVDERFFAAPPGAGKPAPWRTDEQRALRETYPAGGIKAALKALPRRERRAIYAMARRLGLRAPGFVPKAKGPLKYETSDAIDAEIRVVYESAPTRDAINVLSRRLMRPRHWVHKRAGALALAVPRLKPIDWSEPELLIVQSNAHKTLPVIRCLLADHGFRRSDTAIAIKIKRQGFDTVDPNSWTATQLAPLMGVTGVTVARWVREEGLKARRKGTDSPTDPWIIKRRDLRAWIATHAQLVDLRKVDRYWFIDLVFGKYDD